METRLWIGQSRARHPERGDVTGGSQFYHLYRPGARDCIAREFLAHGMVSLHGRCMVKWEETVYREGWKRSLPFPELVAVDPATVTTELQGPTVRMLLERSDLPVSFTEEEAAALVVNVLRAAAPLADAGVMPFDGHLHNSWVWLEGGLEGGHLDLTRIVFGDHTYTLIRGLEFGRPLWCSSEMAHFPPEAKAFKRADEEGFARSLRQLGFAGATLGDIVGDISCISESRAQREQRWKLERAYEEYQVPQELQQALDVGAIEPHRMIQFAIGSHLLSMLGLRGLPAPSGTAIDRCRSVLERMSDVRPEHRFTTLGEAADAVEACWKGLSLPERSIKPWPSIEPRFLIWDVRGGTDPDPVSSAPGAAPGRASGTFPFDNAGPFAASDSIPLPLRAGRGVRLDLVSWFRSTASWLAARPLIPVIAAVLVVSLAANARAPQTPEQALERVQRAKIRTLIAQMADPREAVANGALRSLKTALHEPGGQHRNYVQTQLDARFQRLERQFLARSFGSNGGAIISLTAEARRRAVRELRPLSALGVKHAEKWLDVIRELDAQTVVARR